MNPFIGSPDDAVHDEDILVDPYECHAPSRRSDKELASMLSLLNSLETSVDGKENFN